MLFQLYFKPEHSARLFELPAYRGFGLEPEVNPQIVNDEKLLSGWVRKQLCEFAAMLWFYRNPPDLSHGWIGFTSYRQLDKFSWQFQDISQINQLLVGTDFLAWGRYRFNIPLAAQAETCHPGIQDCITRLMFRHGKSIPVGYFLDRSGFFCSYWLCRWSMFMKWMKWWEPMLSALLEDKWLLTYERAAGALLERLWILWTYLTRVRVRDCRSGNIYICGKVHQRN